MNGRPEAPPPPVSPSELTLKSFLKDNDKLLPALSLFTALTVFANTVPTGWFAYILSFLFLATTGVLYLELRSQFPRELQLDWRLNSWQIRMALLKMWPPNRLVLFAMLLDLSLPALLIYSVAAYAYVWAALLVATIIILLAVGGMWVFGTAAPRMKASIQTWTERHPNAKYFIDVIPSLIISLSLLAGGLIVDRTAVDQRFVSAFRVMSYTAVIAVLFNSILVFRTLPGDISEIRRTRRHIRELQRSIKGKEQQIFSLRMERIRLGDDTARVKAQIAELEQISALKEQAKSAPPEQSEILWRDYARWMDDYFRRYPDARERVDTESSN